MLEEIDTLVASAYPTCVGGQAVERHGHALQPRHMSVLSGPQAVRIGAQAAHTYASAMSGKSPSLSLS